jgi:hypothetical protein
MKIVFALVFTMAVCGPTQAAERIARPSVPSKIEVDPGFEPFLVGHAVGTQNYLCVATTGGGIDWLPIGPQATVFDAAFNQIMTHFQSKNPLQDDAIQATWLSKDTSAAWAVKLRGSTDAAYVAADAIEWLLLQVTGTQIGPTGGNKLSPAVFIQRVNTVGGLKPSAADCTIVNMTRKLVSYEADYYFYR